MTATTPLVFVYDRSAGQAQRQLAMRLAACRHYADEADEKGWALIGRWCDRGDHALSTHRPQLSALLAAMRAAADHREVLCLVRTWERLATYATHRLLLQQRVDEAGGRTVTTFGESDGPSSVILDCRPPIPPHQEWTTTLDAIEGAR
ncbi:recombinase family protein [Streptomyces sioyaensis]|uniref:recombinase family protein n=1 Tax=Streptomyces sioyaensis TaxID=67364 RepID=UPI003D7339FE